MVTIGWQRGVMRLLSAGERVVKVVGVEDLLPSYRRVHLLAPGFLREVAPTPTASLRLRVPDLGAAATLRRRSCTIVDPDLRRGTFALDLVRHRPAGPAAHWADQVVAGDIAEITATHARVAIDPTAGTVVLLGDLSSLPAVNSLLGALPARTGAHVVVIGAPEIAALVRRRPATTVEVVSDGTAQLARLRALDLDRDDCYLWAAGERDQVDAVRSLARRDWRLPQQRWHAQRYWTRDRTPARLRLVTA